MQHISYQWITKQRLRKAGRIRPLVGLEEAKEYNYSVDRPNLCGAGKFGSSDKSCDFVIMQIEKS